LDVIVRKICNVLISVILTAMVISAAVLLVPHVFGYQPYSVLSGSMEPRYHVGSLIFVRPVKPEEIKTGDAVTFTLPGQEKTVATHRVVRIDPKAKTFTTKGDANEVEDQPISFDRLVGRAAGFSVPYFGWLSIFIRTKQGLLTAGCLVLFVILLCFLPDVFKKEEEPKDEGEDDTLENE
jgi:signal peptidase